MSALQEGWALPGGGWQRGVKVFGVANKAEVDVFLELSCFFDDPTDVGNLISGSLGH